ncbi:PHD finger protein 20 isoform X2 [Sitophilus oryzae]|uniref:PHD finger protein 20 isoform X2 n=1 Tax=Sitophilus oryzae TaxID=7048 RepID=A0A6J2XNR1_SITOR|nr:PHD finger protein 20 isoform X2 [Sitophilus oryzae]
MGRKCSVENCTSDSTRPEHIGVTFHKVPHHPDVRPKWISLCRIPDDKANAKVLYVCSRHFLRADFCSFKGKKYMLRQGVLPSVFPWDKSKLEAIIAEVTTKKDTDVCKKKIKPKNQQIDAEQSLQKINITEAKVNTGIKNEQKNDQSDPENADIKIEEKDHSEIRINEETDAFDQHQRAQVSSTANNPINFAISSKIEVLDTNNIWYTAKINEVDYEENEILIHFEKFSNKYDEWISMSSPRLRPLQCNLIDSYQVGEACMAIWNDSQKSSAVITKKIDNNTYEVLFDDGLVKTVKTQEMLKIGKTKPAQASPLFEPVKSTKQERRDKKRKLNVAALFGKRSRIQHTEEKTKSLAATLIPKAEELTDSPSMSPNANSTLTSSDELYRWRPTFENGKPVGIESSLECNDNVRKSYIVPDPRVPEGWQKHLAQRTYGNSAGKWDTFFVGPDGKKLRTKTEIKTYLEQNPSLEVNMEMFDFTIYRNSYKRLKKPNKPKLNILPETQVDSVEEEVKEEPNTEEEENTDPPITLKIIFNNDSYECPIEGCGKNFRRENLALMHVKHYHSEYTKYLDSTPNVADLAYARTVGENLDKSPGSGKPSTPKQPIEKLPVKLPKTPVTETKGICGTSPSTEARYKDSEIIKLLNQKSTEVEKDIQPLSSDLDSKVYPDGKLLSLLTKSSDTPMKDDTNLKQLVTSRPVHGIKTLLPVRPASSENGEEKINAKRKKVILNSSEGFKERMKQEEIINCTCGFTEEDGLMIQCELCLCWQHAYCNNIQKESEVPEKYICYICQHPQAERQSMKYLHDQDWLKQGILPVASYHARDDQELRKKFDKLKKCYDLSGGLLELQEYLHTLAYKLKIAEAKNHPKLYLWSKPWEKSKLPEKSEIKEEKCTDATLKVENSDHQYIKNEMDTEKPPSNDSMLMMMIKEDKEDIPMLNVNHNMATIIPRSEAAIDSDDCRLNLLDHISHAETLIEERLDEFEKQFSELEEGVSLELEADYPKTRQTLQLLIRDLNTLKKFSELPMI